MSEAKADTVPGLGFKDKDKALETLKILEGRDPDYQKLAIKGLIGRAKRTLTRKFICIFKLYYVVNTFLNFQPLPHPCIFVNNIS